VLFIIVDSWRGDEKFFNSASSPHYFNEEVNRANLYYRFKRHFSGGLHSYSSLVNIFYGVSSFLEDIIYSDNSPKGAHKVKPYVINFPFLSFFPFFYLS